MEYFVVTQLPSHTHFLLYVALETTLISSPYLQYIPVDSLEVDYNCVLAVFIFIQEQGEVWRAD
jgi:hypothetical protein